jgi:hypothetical protein
MAFHSFVRHPFLRQTLANQLPTPVNFRESVALELDGFSEFAVDVSAAQKQKIDDLALKIVKSNDTNDPIFEFRVEGFADVVQNPNIRDPKERRRTEMEVSRDRAENGFKLLVEALRKRGGETLAARIEKGSRAFGRGTQDLRVKNPSSEEDRKKNRRVAFIIRQVTFLPPPTPPKPPDPSLVEDRWTVRLVKGGNVTVGALYVLESNTLIATLEITDKVEKKRAEFVVTATGGGFGGGPTKIGGSLTFTPGPSVGFKTFRLMKTQINLKSFEGRVTVFVGIGGGAGPVTRGGTLSFSFDALESSGANTQPSVVEVPGGDSLAAPAISAGDVLPLGVMKMKGNPIDL